MSSRMSYWHPATLPKGRTESMNVFDFRDQLINEYSSFSRSFSRIAAPDIRDEVERQYADGRYWPEPLVQINPNYQRKGTVQELAAEGVLHRACAELFQVDKA